MRVAISVSVPPLIAGPDPYHKTSRRERSFPPCGDDVRGALCKSPVAVCINGTIYIETAFVTDVNGAGTACGPYQ
jgi:hypothetical protein